MIKIKYEERQEFRENPDIGVYAMPKGEVRKRIYFLGIKVYDDTTILDNSCNQENKTNGKKVGF